MKLKQERQKTLYDRSVRGTPLKLGDLVWLHSRAVPRGLSHKLHRPWQGPFVKVINDVTYRQTLHGSRVVTLSSSTSWSVP